MDDEEVLEGGEGRGRGDGGELGKGMIDGEEMRMRRNGRRKG